MNDPHATQDPDAVPVVLINVLKCQPEKQEALLELLCGLMEIQRALPGFVSATLHRGLNGKTVANHAVWRSVDDWKAMTRNPDVSAAMNPVMAIATFEPNLYAPGELID